MCELQSARPLHPSYCRIKADMENTTSSYEWEYYYDYIDPVVVDESQLKYNKCEYLFFYSTAKLLSLGVVVVIISNSSIFFAYRRNSYNILDFTLWLCGVPFSYFESNVSRWKFYRVRYQCICDLI